METCWRHNAQFWNFEILKISFVDIHILDLWCKIASWQLCSTKFIIYIFKNQNLTKKWHICHKKGYHRWDQNNDNHEKKFWSLILITMGGKITENGEILTTHPLDLSDSYRQSLLRTFGRSRRRLMQSCPSRIATTTTLFNQSYYSKEQTCLFFITFFTANVLITSSHSCTM